MIKSLKQCLKGDIITFAAVEATVLNLKTLLHLGFLKS